MKKSIRIFKGLRRCFCLVVLSLFCSCTVMNARYQKWNSQVTRNPEGVLEFAQARNYGEGTHAVLMVHGFGDGPHVWDKLAPELATRGYHVRAMRLPGWAEPVENKRHIQLEDWEQAVQNEVARLREDHEKVAVMAHSMGGCINTVLAQSGQLHADALVLYAPMLEVSSARSPLLKTRTWFKIGNKLLPDQMIIESMFADHARVNAPRPKTRRDPFSPKNIYTLLYEEMDHFEAQPPQMNLPLRLVLPGEDRVVSNERSRKWFEQLAAPTKTMHIEESAGHVLPLDMDVLAETDRLAVWLAAQGIAP